MTPTDFDDCLTAARSGAEWAWSRLYDDLSPAVLSYLRLRGAPDPEDLLGEVFLQVVRDLGGFAGDVDGFRSWVFTIAHRRVVDDHRRRSRRPVEVPDGDLHAQAEPSTNDEGVAITNLATEDVLALLGELTDEQRDALALRVIGSLRLAEVAEVMGKTTGAVKALQRRGLRTLRRTVGPDQAPPYPHAHS